MGTEFQLKLNPLEVTQASDSFWNWQVSEEIKKLQSYILSFLERQKTHRVRCNDSEIVNQNDHAQVKSIHTF